MSSGNKSTTRSKTGSAFKVPVSRKPAKASTPTGDKTPALDCDISAIPSSTRSEYGRHKLTPRCDSSVRLPTSRRQATPAMKALYTPETTPWGTQSGGNKVSKQMELDMAYNTYLLAVTHNTIQEKHYADTKSQIEADLGALTKRLAVNQLNLENTKQRISQISFLGEQERLLQAQSDALTSTVDRVEGPTTDRISTIAAALDEKTDHLELRHIATGTAELKKILADSSRILSQLRASNLADNSESMLTAANHLRNATQTMRSVGARYRRVKEKLPEYRAAPIVEHAMKTLDEEEKDQEEKGEEGSSAVSQP